MGQHITCICAGVYRLTRGRQYQLLTHDAAKQQVRLCADNGCRRWFPASLFDLDGSTVPVLTEWNFSEPVIDELARRDETNNWVDIGLRFDDGTERWCQMVTPNYLRALLTERSCEPMVYAKNMIIVRDLTTATVEQVLRHLDQQGELISFSLPLVQSQ